MTTKKPEISPRFSHIACSSCLCINRRTGSEQHVTARFAPPNCSACPPLIGDTGLSPAFVQTSAPLQKQPRLSAPLALRKWFKMPMTLAYWDIRGVSGANRELKSSVCVCSQRLFATAAPLSKVEATKIPISRLIWANILFLNLGGV